VVGVSRVGVSGRAVGVGSAGGLLSDVEGNVLLVGIAVGWVVSMGSDVGWMLLERWMEL